MEVEPSLFVEEWIMIAAAVAPLLTLFEHGVDAVTGYRQIVANAFGCQPAEEEAAPSPPAKVPLVHGYVNTDAHDEEFA